MGRDWRLIEGAKWLPSNEILGLGRAGVRRLWVSMGHGGSPMPFGQLSARAV